MATDTIEKKRREFVEAVAKGWPVYVNPTTLRAILDASTPVDGFPLLHSNPMVPRGLLLAIDPKASTLTAQRFAWDDGRDGVAESTVTVTENAAKHSSDATASRHESGVPQDDSQ